MKEQIEKVLSDVAAKYNDRRLHVCNLRADVDEEGGVKIAGRVLEASYLEAVKQSLPQGLHVAGYDVAVLREKTKTMTMTMTVATNLTDLHVEPSFLSELLTQMMYGVELEILEEKDRWVFVRQRDGYLGWAYKPYLTEAALPEPTHIVAVPPITAPVLNVYREADVDSPLVTKLLPGTFIHIDGEVGKWAEVRLTGDRSGFIQTFVRDLRMMPGNSRSVMIEDARRFTGTYYLWGGASALGIDCSGLAQLVHRLVGYTIPRDADMQFAAGRPVEEDDVRPGDLLFFTAEHNQRKISHVGISTGGWNMIHSSRFHNGVYEDDVQQRPHLKSTFAGARTFVE